MSRPAVTANSASRGCQGDRFAAAFGRSFGLPIDIRGPLRLHPHSGPAGAGVPATGGPLHTRHRDQRFGVMVVRAPGDGALTRGGRSRADDRFDAQPVGCLVGLCPLRCLTDHSDFSSGPEPREHARSWSIPGLRVRARGRSQSAGPSAGCGVARQWRAHRRQPVLSAAVNGAGRGCQSGVRRTGRRPPRSGPLDIRETRS